MYSIGSLRREMRCLPGCRAWGLARGKHSWNRGWAGALVPHPRPAWLEGRSWGTPASWGTGKPVYCSHPLKRGAPAAGSADWGVSRRFISELQDVGSPSQSFLSSLSGGNAMRVGSWVLQQGEDSQGKVPFPAPQFLSSAKSDCGPEKPDPCFSRNWVK